MSYLRKYFILRFIDVDTKCFHVTTRSVHQDAKDNEITISKIKKIKYELTQSQGSLIAASR